MKVLAISGSPRKGGNTYLLLQRVLARVQEAGIETELVELAGRSVQGCTACLKCRQYADRDCHGRKDAINECLAKIDEADALVIGSPVYFGDVTPETKALIDRTGYVGGANPDMLYRKVGAAVVAQRRAGAVHALASINQLFAARQMIVPGSSYWNLAIGREIGAVEDDAEGMETMENLGRNIAWLVGLTAAARGRI